MIRKTCAAAFATFAFSALAAVPASATPNPSPMAPAHTGTACASVIGHNPQASEDAHSAPVAQQNFEAVGAAMCGL
jgi:Spy/CpxP family protein refolding chaperone